MPSCMISCTEGAYNQMDQPNWEETRRDNWGRWAAALRRPAHALGVEQIVVVKHRRRRISLGCALAPAMENQRGRFGASDREGATRCKNVQYLTTIRTYPGCCCSGQVSRSLPTILQLVASVSGAGEPKARRRPATNIEQRPVWHGPDRYPAPDVPLAHSRGIRAIDVVGIALRNVAPECQPPHIHWRDRGAADLDTRQEVQLRPAQLLLCHRLDRRHCTVMSVPPPCTSGGGGHDRV